MARIASSAAAFTLTVCLIGCSMTVGARAQMDDSSEAFDGYATGYMDGSGKLHLESATGITCDGDFVYINSREGQGTVHCSDGRSGRFYFVSTGTHGTGGGDLNGKKFTFTFGGPAPKKEKSK